MKLLISLATRNRPARLLETVKRSVALWTHPETEMVIQTDADDHATLGALTDIELPPRVSVNVQRREDTTAAKWNRAATTPADVYLISGDDEPCVTEGYDSKILEAAAVFPDNIGMVYGHASNASFSSLMAVTSRWVDILGYILPEHFPYWFSDHWIDDIGRITQRIAFADIRGDQKNIPPTQEMREPGWWATWFDANYLRRRAEAQKIIDAIEEPEWRKTILRSHHPLVEYRSRWINDNVRAQSRAMEASNNLSLKESRYLRVKNAAFAALPAILGELPKDEAARYAAMLVPPTSIIAPPQAFAPLQQAS